MKILRHTFFYLLFIIIPSSILATEVRLFGIGGDTPLSFIDDESRSLTLYSFNDNTSSLLFEPTTINKRLFISEKTYGQSDSGKNTDYAFGYFLSSSREAAGIKFYYKSPYDFNYGNNTILEYARLFSQKTCLPALKASRLCGT